MEVGESGYTAFDSFIKRTGNTSVSELIDEATRALSKARTAKTAGLRYRKMLQGLRWLLQTGSRPSNLADFEFQRLHPVIERLVQRRDLSESALSVFSNR